MKKQIRNICIGGGIAIIALLCSCKNFLNGNDVLEELNKEIEYANLPYASVEFKANIEATKEMSPFVGTYDKNYKKTDSIELSYEPKSSYVFIGWKATPEDSVIFEDKNSLKTKVTINSEGSTIVIEPVVCARPTVSFLPGNAVAVEKNTDVIITFSHELNLTDEVTLDLIKIVNEFGNEIQSTNFLSPVLDETKKIIIFKSNPENLISFEGNTLGITVKVPAVYNYLYENTKVCMEKDTEYSYKINQETSTKLKLKVTAITPEKGSMNLRGSQEFNIGQKQILTINIKDEEYQFDGWIVKNENNAPLSKESYEQYFTFDNDKAKETYINVKNNGSGFLIEPDIKSRPQVQASSPVLSKVGVDRGTDIQIQFNMPMSEESIYWTEDDFKEMNISESAYSEFKAALYNEAFKTKEEILNKDGKNYYYAYRDTNGKVHFKNIEITINGESYLGSNLIPNGFYFTSPYFQTPALLVIPTAKMAFENVNSGRIDVKELPPNSYVDFVISKDMVNTDKVSLYKDYKSSYYINSHYDTEGPSALRPTEYSEQFLIAATTLIPFDLNYRYPAKNLPGSNFDIDKTIKLFNDNLLCYTNSLVQNGDNTDEYTDEQRKNERFHKTKNNFTQTSIDEFMEAYPCVRPAKTLILYRGEVSDFDSVTEIVLLLEYCETAFFNIEPAPEYKTIEISQAIPNKDTVKFDAGENRIVFDVSNIPVQGLYSIKLLGVDSLGNKAQLKPYVLDYDNGRSVEERHPYCMINNLKVSKEAVKVEKRKKNDGSYFTGWYNVTGPAGEYLILTSAKKWANGLNYTVSDFNMAFTFRSENKKTSKPTITMAVEKVDDYLIGSLNKDTQADFLFVRNIFGNLTIFEMIEHEGTNEIELVEYIPPEV